MLLHTVIALGQLAVAASGLTGLVTDTDLRPLSGVSVEARSCSGTSSQSILVFTRPDGTFELPAPPPGGFELTALLDGFEFSSSPLHVTGSSATPIFRLRRTADTVLACTCDPVVGLDAVYDTLPNFIPARYIVRQREFRVVDVAGQPVSGARIELRGPSTLILESDLLGRVCYSGADDLFLRVRIDAPGFLSLLSDICCISGTVTLRRTS